MNDEYLKNLTRACVIMGKGLSAAAAALRAAIYRLDEKANAMTYTMLEETTAADALLAILQSMEQTKSLDELAALVEDLPDIEPPRKQPRPPKRLGPVNKANYTANRPARRARSSCYIRRH